MCFDCFNYNWLAVSIITYAHLLQWYRDNKKLIIEIKEKK